MSNAAEPQLRDGVDQEVQLQLGISLAQPYDLCDIPSGEQLVGDDDAAHAEARADAELMHIGHGDTPCPAASCWAKICGAIVVLPWGASSTPVAVVKSRIHAWLWASAESLITATGKGRSPPSSVQLCAPTADSGKGAAPCGKPLVRASMVSVSMAWRLSMSFGH